MLGFLRQSIHTVVLRIGRGVLNLKVGDEPSERPRSSQELKFETLLIVERRGLTPPPIDLLSAPAQTLAGVFFAFSPDTLVLLLP